MFSFSSFMILMVLSHPAYISLLKIAYFLAVKVGGLGIEELEGSFEMGGAGTC